LDSDGHGPNYSLLYREEKGRKKTTVEKDRSLKNNKSKDVKGKREGVLS